MKEFRVPFKYYVIFFLVFIYPIYNISLYIESYLNGLTRADLLFPLAGLRLNDFAIAVILTLFAYWLSDKFLWRIKPLARLLNLPPDLNGRYKGTLVSSYDQDKTYEIFIEIKQSLSRVTLALYRDNSHSETIVAAIGKDVREKWEIYYIYQHMIDPNHPEVSLKDHTGVAFLEVFNSGTLLRGIYYNNPERGRFGTIEAKRVDRHLLGRYK
jgi:hypothetical protein